MRCFSVSNVLSRLFNTSTNHVKLNFTDSGVFLINSNLRSVSVRRQSGKHPKLPCLTLYTKDPCPLCDIAKEEISIHQHRVSFITNAMSLNYIYYVQ